MFAFLYFQSSDSVHHCNGMYELSFCLDSVVQVEPARHEGQPELFHDIFSCVFGVFCTQFCAWPNSSCRFVRKGSLRFPFCCADWMNSARLSADHQSREQVPKHHPAITTETLSRGDTCRRVSCAHDYQGADDILSRRDTFLPLPTEVTQKLTKFDWWIRKVLIVMIWSIVLIRDWLIRLTTPTPPLHVSFRPPRPPLCVLYHQTPSALPSKLSTACAFSQGCCEHGFHCPGDHFVKASIQGASF